MYVQRTASHHQKPLKIINESKATECTDGRYSNYIQQESLSVIWLYFLKIDRLRYLRESSTVQFSGPTTCKNNNASPAGSKPPVTFPPAPSASRTVPNARSIPASLLPR
jgi:hypothetical protein